MTRTPGASPTMILEAKSDKPSTFGGLVIPPFPPLDQEKRRQRRLSSASASAGGSGGEGSGNTSIIGPVLPTPPAGIRVNGHVVSTPLARGNVFEDEWDEEVVIGGKKLPGSMEDDEGRKEVERVGTVLDELSDPPFTIQRLAELLLDPTKQHASLGKFLRAIEKNLLVTTPWETPSYTAAPPSSFAGSRGLFGPASSASSPNVSPADMASTMPVGATTPMFSPIPFLVNSGSTSNSEQVGGTEEPMSPLVLGNRELSAEVELDDPMFGRHEAPAESSSGPSASTSTAHAASRASDLTPALGAEVDQPAATLSSSDLDPGHQPYLGRVDELDTGPISVSASTSAAGATHSDDGSPERSSSHTRAGAGGTGEGGNMTPHGMSDKPVPLSATTSVEDPSERKVAGLPRTKSMLGLSERFVGAQTEQEGKSDVADDDENGLNSGVGP